MCNITDVKASCHCRRTCTRPLRLLSPFVTQRARAELSIRAGLPAILRIFRALYCGEWSELLPLRPLRDFDGTSIWERRLGGGRCSKRHRRATQRAHISSGACRAGRRHVSPPSHTLPKPRVAELLPAVRMPRNKSSSLNSRRLQVLHFPVATMHAPGGARRRSGTGLGQAGGGGPEPAALGPANRVALVAD